jgi:hypothetical protein
MYESRAARVIASPSPVFCRALVLAACLLGFGCSAPEAVAPSVPTAATVTATSGPLVVQVQGRRARSETPPGNHLCGGFSGSGCATGFVCETQWPDGSAKVGTCVPKADNRGEEDPLGRARFPRR